MGSSVGMSAISETVHHSEGPPSLEGERGGREIEMEGYKKVDLKCCSEWKSNQHKHNLSIDYLPALILIQEFTPK